MELYPGLKPLPTPKPEKQKEVKVKGMIRASVYERRKLNEAFTK